MPSTWRISGGWPDFYHPDVTIFEGGHVNTGWPDYRDNHLGPELKEMADLRFAHVEVMPHALSDGVAYVMAEYRLKSTVAGKGGRGRRPGDAAAPEGRGGGLEDSALAHVEPAPAGGALREAVIQEALRRW